MARQFSCFFDSIEGDERNYVAEEFAQYFRAFFNDGVKELGDNLKVVANGTNMAVRIQPGTGVLQGYFYGLFDDGGGPLELTLDAAGTQTRVDRIVLRLNRTTDVRSIVPTIIKGAAGGDAPAILRTDDLWDLSLAQITVPPGVSVLGPAHIFDERGDSAVCGIIEPYAVKQYLNQGVRTTDSPTFEKVIGAVYA